MDVLKLEYNSTYISINLIDELDYVIGGYGKPNVIFIYSLNAFLEAFIFNSKFYISDQEAKHIQVVSNSMFPNGRPILKMLAEMQGLMAIGGIGNEIGKVVSIEKFDDQNPTSYQERIIHFINHGMPTDDIRQKYLVLPSLSDEIYKISYLNIGRVDGGFIAVESDSSPQKFYDKLCSVTKSTNIQATLPFYSYQFQIEEVQSRGISREIISKLSESFQNKQEKIERYFGYSNQTIPPLVSILLSQCKIINEIPNKMIQLREDFSGLRDAVVKYEKRIEEAETIKDQIDAVDEIDEFWKIFNKKYSGDTRLLYKFWELAEAPDYAKSINDVIDSKEAAKIIDDLNWGKVAGKSVKKAVDWYKEKKVINRFKGVTDIWNLFGKNPSLVKQIAQFESIFGLEIVEKDLIALNERINRIKLNSKKANY
ncbi:MAG: hypothetical protein JST32_07015 [Bacteroidetes bacterium]|nr:hypothetical protein [Bacteroidota bacterium]